jgi:hypothetical protein
VRLCSIFTGTACAILFISMFLTVARRDPVEGAVLKSVGMRAGVADSASRISLAPSKPLVGLLPAPTASIGRLPS